MRYPVLAVLAVGTISSIGPAAAQAWDPDYPVCMHVVGPFNYNECRFVSLAQCAAAASGRAAECMVNPYAARAFEAPPARRHRRHRQAS
jgi:Protein of unknown function (DUF3551)